MIDKIEQAKGRGELTVDEAARLRLTALLEPQALPAAFRPTPDELQSLVQVEPPGYRDGEAALAGPMKALYFDQDLWSAETKAYVESRLVAADAQSLDYSQPAVYSTAHFDIHFDLDPASPDYPGDPGGPYTAISYTLELASALEDTWNIYDDPAQFDFLMPDPTTYFYDALGHTLTRFNVNVLGEANLIVCGFGPLNAAGIALTGEMWINKDDIRHPLNSTIPAHELFHLLQWNYAGFRSAYCPHRGIIIWDTTPATVQASAPPG